MMSDFMKRMRISITNEEVYHRLTEFPLRYRSYIINVALRNFFQTDFSRDLLNVVLRKGKKKDNRTFGGPHRKSGKEKKVSSQTKVSAGEAALEKKSDIEKYLGLDAFRE